MESGAERGGKKSKAPGGSESSKRAFRSIIHVGTRLNEYDGKHGAFREFSRHGVRDSGDYTRRGFVGMTRVHRRDFYVRGDRHAC